MIDNIKLAFTYLNATIVIVGGGYMLYISRAEGEATDFRLVIAGFIGAAITFLFNQESATRSARATERALKTPVPVNGTGAEVIG